MKWLAVHGQIGSGKTTLCKELEGTHLWVNFTDQLKEKACLALHAERPTTTMGEMLMNKEIFRPFIQSFSDLIGYTNNPKYIHEALLEWHMLGKPACAFDNVRTVEQAKTLRAMGFTIVALVAQPYVLRQRVNASNEARSHSVEKALPGELIDVYLDASLPPGLLARQVRAR